MKKYRTGFFILLCIFILFWTWILTTVFSNASPKALIQNLFTQINNQTKEKFIIPVSFYENQNWINNISPDETTITGLSENNNQILIEFNQEMDTSFYLIKERSIYTIGGPIEFDIYWKNKRTFLIQLSRALNDTEYFILKIKFKNTNDNFLPIVVLNYE